MKEEILSIHNICFTGKFTKILNCLSGFISEVEITVSNKEHMQNRIVQTLNNLQKKESDDTKYTNLAKIAVKEILIEFDVPTEQHDEWLDAI